MRLIVDCVIQASECLTRSREQKGASDNISAAIETSNKVRTFTPLFSPIFSSPLHSFLPGCALRVVAPPEPRVAQKLVPRMG